MRFSAILVSVTLWAASEPTKSPIVTSDLLKIRRVTAVDVARAGRLAVYGVQEIHTEPASTPAGEPTYSYRTHLFSIDLNNPTARPLQLTSGDRSDGQIALSPDGKSLACTRSEER